MIKWAKNPKEMTESANMNQSAEFGFKDQDQESTVLIIESDRSGNRQIPTGKNLYIVSQGASDEKGIEATVLKNDNIELAVQLEVPLEISQDENCRVRCDFEDSVWQFDASVVSCYGTILVLKHNDNVRFNDRRRFPRVSVNKAAFIMRFPFSKMLISEDSEEDIMEVVSNTAGESWKPPEFVPAVVRELGGPGLLIEAPLEVRVGERVVVIFKTSQELTLSSLEKSRGISLSRAIEQKEKSKSLKIIEDIGEVRRISHIEDGLSIAVELTGLSNADLNELIQETKLPS